MSNPATEFGGEESFAAAPERLYAVLTDLDTLAATIPDLVSSQRPDERTLKCVVKPGLSFLRGTLKLTITLADLQPGESAAMQVDAQGIGVAMQIVSQLRIAAQDTGSRLTWSARVERMTGLVATISPALVRAAADRTIRHAWQQVHTRLGECLSVPPTSPTTPRISRNSVPATGYGLWLTADRPTHCWLTFS
jgi:carbon monoxide dehydrogenase subunit G